jgi:hypothetical protein
MIAALRTPLAGVLHTSGGGHQLGAYFTGAMSALHQPTKHNKKSGQ